MSSTAQEILLTKLEEEFKQTYTDNDLFTQYCEENAIILTPETQDNYDEDDYNDWLKEKIYEYGELRGYY